MKAGIIFIYVLINVFLLTPFADSNRVYGGIQLINLFAFIAYTTHLLSEVKAYTDVDKLLFQYLSRLSVANFIYIFICIFKETWWAIYNTDIFAYITGISFVYVLTHIAYIRGKK